MRAGFGWAFGLLLLGCGKVEDDRPRAVGAAGSGAQADPGAPAAGTGAGGSDAGGSDAGGSDAGGRPATDCGASPTNPESCGTCGNSCAMGVCEDGECVDVPGISVVAHSAPYDFVSDGQYLYWLEVDGKALESRLVRCSIEGCPGGPTVLLTSVGSTADLTLVDGFTTFRTFGSGASGVTRSCLLGPDCSPQFTPIGGDGSNRDIVQYFATNAKYFAYVTSQGAFVSMLHGKMIGAPTRLFNDVYDLAPLALSDDALLAVSRGGEAFTPVSCTLTGCDDQPTALSAVPTQYPPLLAANGSDAFWLDRGTSLPVTLTFDPTEFSNGGIYGCAAAGCATPTQLVAIDEWYPGAAIAVDESDVYYTAGISGKPGFATLMRCSRKGCANQPTELAAITIGIRSPIVLDDKNVYWTETATGSILKRAK